MTYFPDLAPYSYAGRIQPGVVHVGWLDGAHPFPKGRVDARSIEKMKLLAAKPVELYRGRHICNLCVEPEGLIQAYMPGKGKLIDPESPWLKWAAKRWSNGEIRVVSNGVTFAAPVLIVHYIEEHGYLPPLEFLQAIEQAE